MTAPPMWPMYAVPPDTCMELSSLQLQFATVRTHAVISTWSAMQTLHQQHAVHAHRRSLMPQPTAHKVILCDLRTAEASLTLPEAPNTSYAKNAAPTAHAGAGTTPITRYVAKGFRRTDTIKMALTAPDAPRLTDLLSNRLWAKLLATAAAAYSCKNCTVTVVLKQCPC